MGLARYAVEVRGLTQGVGFRPFVHRLAHRHGLAGSVRNGLGAVLIDVEGCDEDIAKFMQGIRDFSPSTATIESVVCKREEPRGEHSFRISPSFEEIPAALAACRAMRQPSIVVPADLATRDACRQDSRGYAPLPIALPVSVPGPILAVGGHGKSVFALGIEGRAVLSPLLGDLGTRAGQLSFEQAISRFEGLFHVRPQIVVCDLHDDNASSVYARERVQRDGDLELLRVQHHHAHMASCMAEHGLTGELIGVCFDGSGLGEDGTLWGGEFLLGGYPSATRTAHLSAVALPGGEHSAREPWRAALAYLHQAGLGATPTLRRAVEKRALQQTEAILERPELCTPTTSAGRLFDAVASLSGLIQRASYEGHAACLLEAQAALSSEKSWYPFDHEGDVIDTGSLIREVVSDTERGVHVTTIARRLHNTLVRVIAEVCQRIRQASGCDRVVLSGDVFVNRILASEVPPALEAVDFRVFSHRVVPPNDGGLCLGQLAVAAVRYPRAST